MKRLRLSTVLACAVLILGTGWFGMHAAHAQTGGLTETFAQQAGFSTNADIRLTIARLIRTFLSVLGIILVVLVLYGGFTYMTAAGDEQRVARAKRILTNAVIGLVIILSSFAIAQFVISSLQGATGGGTIVGGGPGGGGGFFGDGGSGGQFVLKSFNAECAAALQNFEPQLVFSANVDRASVDAGGISVSIGGTPVAGSFAVSGSRVSFTPDQACAAPNAQEHCFPASAQVNITLNPALLKSAAQRPLVCNSLFPCTENVTTGTGVDTRGPTLAMTAPAQDASVIGNDIVPLQTSANDDTGVATVEFTAAGTVLAPASGLSDSNAGGLSPTNFFNTTATEWDTAGLVTNKRYSLSATGFDCAGHQASAAAISVTLRAPNCSNGTQDSSLGETGVDCGGTGEFACGACINTPCGSDAECSTGQCTNGVCTAVARIDQVSPDDGASGNLVTIMGVGFGATPGTVTFLGTESGDEVRVTDFACNGQTGWSDRQIVVRVPNAAADGPILVQTSNALSDRTDDASGPHVADFDVNDVVRPGLCFMNPDTGAAGSQSTASAIHLGASQGSSSLFFGSTQAASYLDWRDDRTTVIVPPLDARSHLVQAFVGDNTCSVSNALCRSDADCGASGGTCVIRRQASNQIRFTALSSANAAAAPNVTVLDSGWTACKGGSNANLHCAADSDCPGSTCGEAPNFGPPGQYVTLSGTHFGTSNGTVRFTSRTGGAQDGQEAVADVNFPAACGDLFWHDGSVTVKVPKTYGNGRPVEFGAHKVRLVRANDGAISNELDFNVVNDAPGPSLCLMSPLSGPVGTLVTFEGENFGAAKGTALFTPNQSVSPGVWGNTEVSDAGVTAAVTTGPVQLRSAAGYHTNNVPFEVADCRDNALVCGAGTQCCSDGSCRPDGQCTVGVQNAFYAWRFGTGPIPKAPHLVYQCSNTVASPAPWEGFSKPQNVCLNAAVSGTFDEEMDQATLNPGNVSVQKCTGSGSNPCSSLAAPLVAARMSTGTTSFIWEGPGFEPDSTYQVTLKGGAIRSSAALAGGAEPLEKDETWRFKTGPAGTQCTIGAINVAPAAFTATEKNQQVAYLAQTVSAADKCVALGCGFTFNWGSNPPEDASLASGQTVNDCKNVATALLQTNPGRPADITAAVQAVFGTGKLTIDFVHPEVVSFAPNCDSACVNAALVATFNTKMNGGTLEAPGAVTLKRCENSLCVDNLTNVAVTTAYDETDPAAPRITLTHPVLIPNTHYKVIVSGAATSASGVPLSLSGANDGANFSWIFTTKNSDVSCAIDRVDIVPDLAKATFVGEHKEFKAHPFGAPDECTKDGQELDPADYAWTPWTSKDAKDGAAPGVVASLEGTSGSGAITLAAGPASGCTSACISAGTSFAQGQAFCGDTVLSRNGGEDCDGGVGCSPSCQHIGAGSVSGGGTCGNRTIEAGEDCDDGNATNGDGCSSRCLDEGARAVGSVCGDGVRDFSASRGGESCDDGNATSGDGCSANCLTEGSVPFANARAAGICGDGIVKSPAESCDDGNSRDGDGCSARCLKEGANPVSAGGTCGNGTVQANEECDGGVGCSGRCLLLGSSASYPNASFCADGVAGTGEVAACEIGIGPTKIGPYAVATVQVGAATKVDPATHEATSIITGSAGAPPKSGAAALAVECSCQSDAACGNSATLACGNGSCCYLRPTVVSIFPNQNGTNVCRNTTVQVTFSTKMDGKTFDKNLYLELTKIGAATVTAANCPYGALASANGSWVARAWSAVKAFFVPQQANAQAAGTRCLVPVTYAAADAGNGSSVVDLAIKDPLVANGTYRVVVVGDANPNDLAKAGVLSADGAGLNFAQQAQSFQTGTDICALDKVVVTDNGRVESLLPNSTVPPSRGRFTKAGEVHSLAATGTSIRNGQPAPIQPTTAYAWNWAWNSDPGTADRPDALAVAPVNPPPTTMSTNTTATTATPPVNGEENAYATATITVDSLDVPTKAGQAVTGSVHEVVLLCENPWPALSDPFPYVDPDTSSNGSSNSTNFSLYYCRDAGAPGTADDLPELLPTKTTGSPVQNLVKETLFTFAATATGPVPDALGVRVIANPGYLPPDLWYKAQGFRGSPTPTTLDGYQAVRDGNTVYAVAANQTGSIYPNVYAVSTSDQASAPALAVFDQVQKNFRLNANTDAVTDVNLCRLKGGNYVDADAAAPGVQFKACVWDGDCATFKDANGVQAACDAEKAKLRRDTKRLTDLVKMKSLFDAFALVHSHCAVSKAACTPNAASCSGGEACVPDVPTLAEGSFIRTITTSAWPSWQDALGAALGVTLPVDPLNKFFQCAEGADPATCYNATTQQFQCTVGSHVYGYQSSGGETYSLSVQIEHTKAPWAFPIDANANDNASLRAEYPAP